MDSVLFVCMHMYGNVDVCAYVMSLFQRSHKYLFSDYSVKWFSSGLCFLIHAHRLSLALAFGNLYGWITQDLERLRLERRLRQGC